MEGCLGELRRGGRLEASDLTIDRALGKGFDLGLQVSAVMERSAARSRIGPPGATEFQSGCFATSMVHHYYHHMY